MKKAKRRAGAMTRKQVAAVPFRRSESGDVQVLLVTSRATRRWILPKGWPMKGLSDWRAAAREAFEEAGVTGDAARKPAGRYTYWKRMADHFVLCEVDLYPLAVHGEMADFAEKGERMTRWFDLRLAVELVDEPSLKVALRRLALPGAEPGSQ